MGGFPAYPDPSKGWLEQDAETMLVFEIFDEAQAEREKVEEARKVAREKAATLMQGYQHF